SLLDYLLLNCLQRRKDTVRPRVDAHRRYVTPPDHALGVDDEQGSFAEAVRCPIDAVCLRHRALRLEVRKEREMELPFRRERRVTPRAVHGDPEELRLVASKLRHDLVVERHLVSADGAP